MLIGVPRETFPGERRVALVPAVIPTLAKAGLEVAIEAGAGTSAGYLDTDYAAKGTKSAIWHMRILTVLLLLHTIAGRSPAQPAGPSLARGTITPVGLNGEGQPLQLIEVSPGKFLAMTDGPPMYFLDHGTITPWCTNPSTVPIRSYQPFQAVNGRVYASGGGSQGGKNVAFNFSFDLGRNSQVYPNQTAPVLTVAEPDGNMFGTQWGTPSINAFVRMALDGTLTNLHSFTSQDGVPSGLPILADNGELYGISIFLQQASVYRMSPTGTMKTLVTYPDDFPASPSNTAGGESLLQASNGKLYGLAFQGGSNNAGGLWRMDLDGADYKVLYQYPHRETGTPTLLTQASDGNLYGIAQGAVQQCSCSTLFRMRLDGRYETMQHLNAGQLGGCPCWMVQGSDGKFYGSSGHMIWIWDLGLPAPKPIIKSLLPHRGAAGSTVTISGDSLLGATAISFNGAPATSFTVMGKQFITATVPSGATSGTVTVTTPNGTAASPARFTVK